MKQSFKILIGTFAAIGVISTAAMFATPAFAQMKDKEDEEKETQEKSVKMTPPAAKITPVKAMKAAEAKVGGEAKMAIFEFDEGHWVYGVVVAKKEKLMEVDVDPITGKAGDSEEVTPADEAKEFEEGLSKLLESKD